jgi:hypothetical protein
VQERQSHTWIVCTRMWVNLMTCDHVVLTCLGRLHAPVSCVHGDTCVYHT